MADIPTAPVSNLSPEIQAAMYAAGGTKTAPISAPKTPAPNNFSLTSTDSSGKTTNQTPTTPAPTIITNADITSKTIPQNTQALADASKTGITVGPDGQQRYANSTLVTPASPATPMSDQRSDGTSPNYAPGAGAQSFGAGGLVYTPRSDGTFDVTDSNGQYYGASSGPGQNIVNTAQQENTPSTSSTGSRLTGDPTADALIKQMDDITARGDARTASTIQNIQTQYQSLIDAQNEVNRQDQGSITQSLLVGGSSRYAGASSPGILAAVMSNGIQKISLLTSQENDLIDKAQQAQDDADYKSVADKLAEYQKVTAAKQAETDKLNAALQAQSQKVQDQKNQASKDESIATLFSSGMTDPSQILATLQKNGQTDITLSDIGDSLKTLSANAGIDTSQMSGDVKEYFALQKAGILPASISSLPANQQPFAYVAYKADLTRKATAAAADKDYTFTSDQKGKLLGTGLSKDEVDHIQEGINNYGLSTVLQQETGLNQDQKDILGEVVTGKAKQFIDADYITKTFDADKLRAAAKNAGDVTGGFWGMGKEGDTAAYAKSLMDTVNLYRDQGMSDKDIFTKLETKING